MESYLKQPNVPAVGGSWLVKNEQLENEDWVGIVTQAAEVKSALSNSPVLQSEIGPNSTGAVAKSLN